MKKTKRTEVAQPSLRSRCHAINAAIREGIIVKANIQGEMQMIISIRSDDSGVSLLFHDAENRLALLRVAPDAILEFTMLMPRTQESAGAL